MLYLPGLLATRSRFEEKKLARGLQTIDSQQKYSQTIMQSSLRKIFMFSLDDLNLNHPSVRRVWIYHICMHIVIPYIYTHEATLGPKSTPLGLPEAS